MHPHELVVGGGVGLDELERCPGRRMGFEPPPQSRVFGDRKPVPLR
jgi:hypothetical protein